MGNGTHARGRSLGRGPRYAEMLHAHDIFTTWDLRNTPDDWIRQQMTVVGLGRCMAYAAKVD